MDSKFHLLCYLWWIQIFAKMGKGGVHHVHTLNPKRAEYEGHFTGYVLLTCVVGAFGGLIFGYDIGISGNAKVQ